MHIFPEELIEKIRDAIKPEAMLGAIDYRVETIQIIGSSIKAFCPIHREPIFRTLLIDLNSGTYRCSNKHCPGHDGGDMIDLYAKSKGLGYEEALPELAGAFDVEVDLSVAEEYVERAREIGNNYLEMGAHDDAEEQFERILRFQPSSVDALRGLHRLYAETGRQDDQNKVALKLAGALAADEQDEEAAGLLKGYVADHPDDTPTRLLYIECLKRLGDEEWVAGEYVNLADHLAAQGEIDQALEIYRRIEAMSLESIDVSMHVVQILSSAGRLPEAVAEMTKRAGQLHETGEDAGAVACLQQAIEIAPERDDLRLELVRTVAKAALGGPLLDEAVAQVRALIDAQGHGPAGQGLEALIAAFPGNVTLLELKADLEEGRGHHEAALDLRLECLDLHEQRKELDRALAVLAKALAHGEDNVELLSRQAGLLRELDRTAEAVAAYLKIVNLFESADEFANAAAVYQTVVDLEPEIIEHRTAQFELNLRLGLEPIVVKSALSLAEAFAVQGDRNRAAAILGRGLSVAPGNPELLSRHAELLEKLDRRAEAAEQYLEVARLYVDQQLHDRARQRLENALACAPEHVEARELKADVLVHQGMTLQAMSEYGELSQTYLTAGESENVIRVSNKILAIQPDHLSTLQSLTAAHGLAGDVDRQRQTQMRLVHLFRQTQSYTKASDLCERILDVDPDCVDALEQMIAISGATKQTDSEIASLWRLAEVYARATQREQEQGVLDRILAREALHRMAWQRNLELMTQWASPRALAEAVSTAIEKFTEASRPGEIIQILEELRASPTAKPEILGGLARLRRSSGDEEGAKTALREQTDLLSRALRDEEAIEILGELADESTEDLSIRTRRIELMIRTDQRDAAADEHRRLAEIYVERHRLEDAERAYQEVLKINPADNRAREELIGLFIRLNNLGRAADAIEDLAAHYIREGEYERAAAVYERVFEFDPKREETFRKVIAVKQRASDVVGAIDYYNRLLDLQADEGHASSFEQTALDAIALDPSNWPLRCRLVDHLVQVGRTGEAEGALLELAGLQLKSDNLDASTQSIDRVLEINPTSVQGRAYRAEIMAKRGETDDALKEFLTLTGSLGNIRAGRAEDANGPFAFGNYEGLTRVREYSFDNFVVGARNNFAHATAMAVARAPGKNYNPLFLYAEVGLGKTHLCHAVANHVLEHHPDLKVMYTMTEDFIGALIDGIQNNSITAFRNRHRVTDVLIIDDIQFLSGKERAQEEFFHIFNALFEAGKQIIITSDHPPKEISHLENRLRSRFGAGIIVDIQTPDLETRIAILRKELFQRGRGDELTNEVVLYLAEHIPNNIRDLKGALNQVLAMRDVTESTIDLDLVRQAVDQVTAQA